MSTPQQRVYYQEPVASFDSPGTLRLCSQCISSLRAELKSKGQEGLDAEVQKFTRDLAQGGERQTILLDQLEEMPLPQRAEGSEAPILSNDVDARWVQVAPHAATRARLGLRRRYVEG